MTEVMKRQLLSYVVYGTDNGQIMQIKKLKEMENGLEFEAEYTKDKYTGLCNERGKVSGTVELLEQDNQKNILIKCVYKGTKDNNSYQYSKSTAFQMMDNHDTRIICKAEQVKDSNGDVQPIKKTWYESRLSTDGCLGDYIYNCGARNALSWSDTQYKVKKMA